MAASPHTSQTLQAMPRAAPRSLTQGLSPRSGLEKAWTYRKTLPTFR